MSLYKLPFIITVVVSILAVGVVTDEVTSTVRVDTSPSVNGLLLLLAVEVAGVAKEVKAININIHARRTGLILSECRN